MGDQIASLASASWSILLFNLQDMSVEAFLLHAFTSRAFRNPFNPSACCLEVLRPYLHGKLRGISLEL